jgi:hypothetical protein
MTLWIVLVCFVCLIAPPVGAPLAFVTILAGIIYSCYLGDQNTKRRGR